MKRMLLGKEVQFHHGQLFWVFLIIWIFSRLLLLTEPALIDPSEGRFAGSALHMLLSGDWIVPRIHDYGDGWVPYLAKPPLHMWLTAFSFAVLGVSELAARLPSFIAVLLCSALIWHFGRHFFPLLQTKLSALFFLTAGGIFLFAPSCLTDASLSLCVTLAYVSFGLVQFTSARKLWGYLFFVALALGMLVKGPVAIMLVGTGLFLWLLLSREWRGLCCLPWIPGIGLFLALVTPWYLLAETKNPGFLRYFFLHENFLRYLHHDFGIRFGSAHSHWYGMIWFFLFAVFLPWSFLSLKPLLVKSLRSSLVENVRTTPVHLYIFSWMIGPMIFFTFARNILPTYTFPVVPAWALFVGGILYRREEAYESLVSRSAYSWVGDVLYVVGFLSFGAYSLIGSPTSMSLWIGMLLAYCVWFLRRKGVLVGSESPFYSFLLSCVFCVTMIGLALSPEISDRRSTRAVLKIVRQEIGKNPGPIVVLYNDPRSVHFYKHLVPNSELFSGRDHRFLEGKPFVHLLVKTGDFSKIPPFVKKSLVEKQEIGGWRYFIYRESPETRFSKVRPLRNPHDMTEDDT